MISVKIDIWTKSTLLSCTLTNSAGIVGINSGGLHIFVHVMSKFWEMVRKLAFWTKDYLKGGCTKKHFGEIEDILNNYSSIGAQEIRKKNLSNLLNHAAKNTEFYSGYRNFSSLSDFPVVNKNIIRKRFEDFIAKQGYRKPTYKVQTSGSTGTPFYVYQDRRKRTRNTADTIFFGKKGGYELGQPLYYIRRWGSKYKKSLLLQWVQNIRPVEVASFSNEYLTSLLKKVSKHKKNIAFLGYASAYRDLCDFLANSDIRLNARVSSIIAMSEALSQKTKKDMESFFGIPIVSRYSNMENGIIAQQFQGLGDDFHINWASYFVEILEIDSDRPTKNGELGRVVVTDLFNYCTTMIRYDTGDLAIMDTNNSYFNSAPVLKKIEGRKMDVLFDTSGRPISPFVAGELEYFNGIRQYQVIQEDAKLYKIVLNVDDFFAAEHQVTEKMRTYLGNDAEIKFEYVNEIPRLASGKRKQTINLYQKQE